MCWWAGWLVVCLVGWLGLDGSFVAWLVAVLVHWLICLCLCVACNAGGFICCMPGWFVGWPIDWSPGHGCPGCPGCADALAAALDSEVADEALFVLVWAGLAGKVILFGCVC